MASVICYREYQIGNTGRLGFLGPWRMLSAKTSIAAPGTLLIAEPICYRGIGNICCTGTSLIRETDNKDASLIRNSRAVADAFREAVDCRARRAADR